MKKLILLLSVLSINFTLLAQIPGGFGAAPKKEAVIPSPH